VVNSFPEVESRTKTSQIMDYLVSRGNEEIAVERIANGLKMDQKTVASIASRLVSRGLITRTSRGVYIHRQESIKASTIGGILDKLEKTIRRTFGGKISDKTAISRIEDRENIRGLELALRSTRRVLGTRGANNIFKLVTKKVAKPSETKYILSRLGISS